MLQAALEERKEERKAMQVKLEATQVRLVTMQVKLETTQGKLETQIEISARWEERCRMLFIFAMMMVIAYFIW